MKSYWAISSQNNYCQKAGECTGFEFPQENIHLNTNAIDPSLVFVEKITILSITWKNDICFPRICSDQEMTQKMFAIVICGGIAFIHV